jgi:hypothetical protein
VHGCLEGPEAGVYYRGEGIIPQGKTSTCISLPEYTKDFYDFTVNITPILEEEETELKIMNATNVKNGSFRVLSNESGKFHWIVYGKRHSIETEPRKTDKKLHGDGPYQWLS